MSAPWSDRNLLLGIVALQMDFISRDGLIAAMHRWTLDKSRSLAEILEKNGELDPDDRSALEVLVERHIAHHGGDPEKSLSAVEVVGAARETLESLADPDIHESLSKLGSTLDELAERYDPERTFSRNTAAGEPGGRYHILHLHDQGGLGNVFKARDCEVNRDVALKQLKEEIAADAQSRARFVFEAEITGNLEHPGIVPLYGKGEDADGRPYYAMRFIHGDNLKIAVDQLHKASLDSGARRREFQKLLRRFLVVCETMSYAHSRGIIHRDLKPRNILLGPYGETLVVDWGLAKMVGLKEAHPPADATLRPPSSSDIQPTTAGSRVGTPAYMSPEQARGEVESVGPAADIYSLGATLYYMLTGRSPFTEQEAPEILLKVERGEFPRPREVNADTDRALEAICLKAMALKPADRYASCRGLADDLEHWLADQPVSAYPEPLSVRSGRWLRRRKQLVAGAAFFLIVGVVGLIFHDWRLGRANDALIEARHQTARQLRLTEEARDQTAQQLITTRAALWELNIAAGVSLANHPGTEPVRAALAHVVLSLYEKLHEAYPNDHDVVFGMAQAFYLCGGIARISGQFEESLSFYRNVLASLQPLLQEPAKSNASRRLRVKAVKDRGELYHMNGRLTLAREDMESALEGLSEIAEDLDPAEYRQLTAETLLNRAEIMTELGQPALGHADANQAVILLKPSAHDVPVPLAMALTDRGSALAALQQHAAAERDFNEALRVLRSVPQTGELDADLQLQTASTLNQLGILLGKDGKRRADARKCFDEAVRILEPIVTKFAQYPSFRQELAHAHHGRADVLLSSDLIGEARRDCAAARRLIDELLRSSPANAEFLSLAARSRWLNGRALLSGGAKDEARNAINEAIDSLQKALALDRDRTLDRELLERLRSAAIAPRP